MPREIIWIYWVVGSKHCCCLVEGHILNGLSLKPNYLFDCHRRCLFRNVHLIYVHVCLLVIGSFRRNETPRESELVYYTNRKLCDFHLVNVFEQVLGLFSPFLVTLLSSLSHFSHTISIIFFISTSKVWELERKILLVDVVKYTWTLCIR